MRLLCPSIFDGAAHGLCNGVHGVAAEHPSLPMPALVRDDLFGDQDPLRDAEAVPAVEGTFPAIGLTCGCVSRRISRRCIFLRHVLPTVLCALRPDLSRTLHAVTARPPEAVSRCRRGV